MELIIISGVSGAGKTIATKAIEDMQFSCIDALPSKIILDTVNSLIKVNILRLELFSIVVILIVLPV